MSRNFMRTVSDLIRENPGQRPEEYAKAAIDRGYQSGSKDPIGSLATTLRRGVRDGKMPGITAQKVAGCLHFYPASINIPSSMKDGERQSKEPRATGTDALQGAYASLAILVPQEMVKDLDLLIELNKARNRSEALLRFVQIGINEKRVELERAREFAQKTKQGRESFSL